MIPTPNNLLLWQIHRPRYHFESAPVMNAFRNNTEVKLSINKLDTLFIQNRSCVYLFANLIPVIIRFGYFAHWKMATPIKNDGGPGHENFSILLFLIWAFCLLYVVWALQVNFSILFGDLIYLFFKNLPWFYQQSYLKNVICVDINL